MFKTLANSFIMFLAWIKRKQKVKIGIGPVKVNIGCGLSVVDGWFNVDASPNAFFSKWPAVVLKLLYKFSGSQNWYSQKEYIEILRGHTFVHHRLEYGIPFGDNTIDYLYSSHLLEHLFREDAADLMKDAFRTLKEGGRIRIGVPDLKYAVGLFQEGRKEKALEFFFKTSQGTEFGQHHYMYDFDMLRRLLESVGFVDVEQYSFREGKACDLSKLDTRANETLYVEAEKSKVSFI